jgi:hypothetical protein
MRNALALLFAAASLSAQPVQYSEARKTWLLTTATSSYAMGVAEDGALRNLYWGPPLWRIEDLAAPARRRDLSSFDPRQMLENEEFPGWGGPGADLSVYSLRRATAGSTRVARRAGSQAAAAADAISSTIAAA